MQDIPNIITSIPNKYFTKYRFLRHCFHATTILWYSFND